MRAGNIVLRQWDLRGNSRRPVESLDCSCQSFPQFRGVALNVLCMRPVDLERRLHDGWGAAEVKPAPSNFVDAMGEEVWPAARGLFSQNALEAISTAAGARALRVEAVRTDS